MAAGAQSLYRKHRPRTFADVVGQDAVVRTLRHAVERGQVHHAYLFVGSRGTGKTSMAKILASCLNCDGVPTHPTVEPCGRCDSCRAIAAATSLDVVEMDAASNNSVDDIRELRDSVAFAPVSGRHKVYILDEAHMLSQAAWNAFLKTLEEPPPATVFVLATTEAGKVPATVVDRCHRFDFQRPTVEQIAAVLTRAASAESIEIPPQAVAQVARASTGSFRDALGTLEQLVTYSGARIELADVLAVLGVADEGLVADALDAVVAGDAPAALRAVARCADAGRDASAFTRDLETRARELLVVHTLGEVPAELSLTPEIDARLRAQAQRVGPAEAVRALDLLGAALEAVRAGADPRTQLELALVKAAQPAADPSLTALLARIERLERVMGNPSTPAPPAPIAAGAPDPPVAAVPEPPPASVEAPSSVAEPPAPAPGAVPPVDDSPAPTPPAEGAIPVAEPPAPEAPPLPAPGDLDALWAAALETVRGENKLLRAFFSEAAPTSLDGRELVVTFAPAAAFNKRKAEEPANRRTLLDALQRLTGTRYQVTFELSDEPPENGGAEREDLSEEEMVERLIAELDAEELSEDLARTTEER